MDDTMSFTVMSENVLEEPYKMNYYNVYQKGALIGMCIDILMREESNGNRGILSLMKELSMKYGINKPFDDESLFEEITEMTYPSIGEFFNTHVIGTRPIDYNEFFKKVGLKTEVSRVETNFIMNDGAIIFAPNTATGEIAFNDLVTDNSFWNENGVKPGDVVKEVNGEVLSFQNAQQIFTQVYMWKPDIDIDVKLDRNGEEIVVKTKTTQSYTTGRTLSVDESANQDQIDLRQSWLKG